MNKINFSKIIKNIYTKNFWIKFTAIFIPLIIALYIYNPFDNILTFYWDQSYLLEDKNVFSNLFFFMQERFGFGAYGYYLNFIVYSTFSFIFGPGKGMDITMILLVQTAFWGVYLLLKEITQATNKLVIYLLALLYIVSFETQLNVYRTVIAQNFLWGLLPLVLFLTIKVIRSNLIRWQIYLAITLFFFQVSFAHPTSVINYSFILSAVLILSLFRNKISVAKIIRIIVINILVFTPILLQILLMKSEVSGFIYNSNNTFGGDYILSWYELGKDRFNLSNILRLNYFLESQIRTDTFDGEYLLRLSNLKINNAFNVYTLASILNLGLFAIIIFPLVQGRKILNKINDQANKNDLNIYSYSAFFAMFSIAVMAMFQGPLLQLFGLVYKVVPTVFLLYRYLDAKFGVVFILVILIAVAASQKIIQRKIVQQLITVFLILLNVFYLGFISTKFFVSPYSQLEIPSQYNDTCKFLKQNSFRTIKAPYSYDFLQFSQISERQVLSNDVFTQNCDHPIITTRSLSGDTEFSIINLYNSMQSNPEQFKKDIKYFGIDTLMVDKKFVPNKSWYRIYSEEQKQELISNLEVNFKENKILENEYFVVYKFQPVAAFELSSGNLSYTKNTPTDYNLRINNINQDVDLEFQYAFSNWRITDYSSKYFLGDNLFQHTKARGFNNKWSIKLTDLQNNCPANYCTKNSDGSYNLNLELWYQPQIVYQEIMIIFIVILLSYISISTYSHLYVKKNK
jgi:hypothetical protein